MGYTFRPEGGGEVMPWKESSVMDERMRFVIRLKDGEPKESMHLLELAYTGCLQKHMFLPEKFPREE